MVLPMQLREAIEAQIAELEPDGLKRDARSLSEKYRAGERSGARLLTEDSQAAAYAVMRMPATYCAVHTSLANALEICDIRADTLLDAGAGTGAASWAADSLLDFTSITCIEREDAMARLGRNMMQWGSEALNHARWIRDDLMGGTPPGGADVVVASYVLNEMTPESSLKAAQALWKAAGVMLLLVEPGTPAGYALLRDVRRLLVAQGAHVAAPCPREDACPMAAGDWCHFTCRVARSPLHRRLKDGDAPYEDEKFAYLALVREDCVRAGARILRHPQMGKGRVGLTLCTRDGIVDASVTKKDRNLYKQARKAGCGDAFDGDRWQS